MPLGYLILGFIILFSGLQTQAVLQVGEAVFSGAGCGQAQSMKMRQQDSKYDLQIPLHLSLKKDKSKKLIRKSCSFRLSLKPGAGKKIILRNYGQTINSEVGPGAELHYSVNASFVGQKTESLELQTRAINQKIQRQEELKSNMLNIESKCGQSVMLAAQSSSYAQSAGTVSLSSKDLKVTLQLVRCQ